MLIVINFKTYKEATAEKALRLAKICKRISKKKKIKIIVAVQATDIFNVSKIIPVLAQHVDFHEQGKNTGKILPEAIKKAGAIGTLINHSENPLPLDIIKKTIKRCKDLNLLTIVCTSSLRQARKILKFKPYAIAYEIPELIASGKSITKVKPDSVRKFSSILKNKSIALCGAGISSSEDIKLAFHLGCEGVLVSSAIVKAKNQEKALKKLLTF